MTNDSNPNDTRKTWQTPELHVVSPANATRGGGGTANDQDDAWYDAS
ncbi:hypothetical protein [Sphingopyxis sp. KK2]|nr:hypothetical protein [Sphingopyxis sp. KK2]